MAQSPNQLSVADAERIRQRYPAARISRPLWIVLIAIGTAIAGSWLVWAGLTAANPKANAVVTAYTVRSDTEIEAVLAVDRADPSKTAACRVVAQATDYQVVAERTVTVPPSANKVVSVTLTMTTLRRATTAVVKGCSLV